MISKFSQATEPYQHSTFLNELQGIDRSLLNLKTELHL